MGRRYQGGYLRLSKRKAGPYRWEFLWREVNPLGKVVRRKAIIGTVEQYPTSSAASDAINGLRVSINEDRNRQWGQNITVADLVDHYKRIELSNDSVWHAYATRVAYQDFMERYIRPRWGTLSIRQVRTVDVEMWLRQLRRVNGLPLANSTKAKIRSLMSVLFNHAIRYEWLEQGKNPTTLARQSAKRMRVPDILEVEEISALLAQLDSPFRLMVLVAATTGLRRSELFALRWSDVDFLHLEIRVMRSIFRQVIGDCKTEGSRRPVPIDASLAADLWMWREATLYRGPDDWIFASRHTHGLQPFWPDMILTKVVRRAAKASRN